MPEYTLPPTPTDASAQPTREEAPAPVTPVLFRFWRGDVIALFPDTPADLDAFNCLSYQHIGQHGSANLDRILDDSRVATLIERARLYVELQSIGYNLRSVDASYNRAESLARRSASIRAYLNTP